MATLRWIDRDPFPEGRAAFDKGIVEQLHDRLKAMRRNGPDSTDIGGR